MIPLLLKDSVTIIILLHYEILLSFSFSVVPFYIWNDDVKIREVSLALFNLSCDIELHLNVFQTGNGITYSSEKNERKRS
jgi:hypothetical protein